MANTRKDERKLSPLQERFVTEYIIDLNATQAAIRAGYSPKTAQMQSSRLLSKAMVAQAIAAAKAARAAKTGITAERVLRELELLAFSNHAHFSVDDTGSVQLVNDAPEEAHRSVSAIKHRIESREDGLVTRTVEIKLWDKPGMLKLAGRHVGLFPDKLELSGKDGAPLFPPEAKMTRAEMQREIERLEALAAAGDDPKEEGDQGEADPPSET
jgi:phage terminase small subunit